MIKSRSISIGFKCHTFAGTFGKKLYFVQIVFLFGMKMLMNQSLFGLIHL